MSDLLERTDLDLTLLFADDPEPGCEGETHPQGKWGHQPGHPAAYLTVTPCGFSLLVCAGWAEARMAEVGPTFYFRCTPGCRRLHVCDDLTHIPINE